MRGPSSILWRRNTFARVVLLAVLVPLGCRTKGDPIRQALDSMAAAAEKRDADRLIGALSPDFRSDTGASLGDAAETIRRSLAVYQDLSVRLSDVRIERNADGARATFRADLGGTVRKVGGLDRIFPRTSAWHFELRLVPAEGTWKVAWASWAQLQ
jgi:hypothetical protein